VEAARLSGDALPEAIVEMLSKVGADVKNTAFGSTIYANCPGDGSAREQAASCQRVLGGVGNIAHSYATKRYRSNLINWGIIPFVMDGDFTASDEDYIYIEGVRSALVEGKATVTGRILSTGEVIELQLKDITPDERDILLLGSLINYYAAASGR